VADRNTAREVGRPARPSFRVEEDTLRIGDLTFEFTPEARSNVWQGRDEKSLLLHKSAYVVQRLDAFFSAREFEPSNVFELGMWDGGSTAFWFEYFQPQKHVAVDRLEREDSAYFKSYVSRRGLEDRLKTYWGVDQADGNRLLEIVNAEFPRGRLDLVLDDASHELEATRRSFETLFPLLRPGGIYLIEDWSWELLDRPSAGRTTKGLVELVHDLVKLTGTGMIRTLTAELTFVAAERSKRRIPLGEGSRPRDAS
jgi:predicted O-methyltransferase YrrM